MAEHETQRMWSLGHKIDTATTVRTRQAQQHLETDLRLKLVPPRRPVAWLALVTNPLIRFCHDHAAFRLAQVARSDRGRPTLRTVPAERGPPPCTPGHWAAPPFSAASAHLPRVFANPEITTLIAMRPESVSWNTGQSAVEGLCLSPTSLVSRSFPLVDR